jgi:hypothetical protein
MARYTEWYYPGGYVQDVGNLPREDPNQLGWDLFFTFNPNADRAAHLTATFYYETAPPRDLTYTLEPLRRHLFWLHHPQYREYTGGVNNPYGVRLMSDHPVFPHWTRGEYESWDEHCPTGMFGVPFHEGPLTDELDWYLPEGCVQAILAHPTLATEWLSILNPNHEDAELTLTFTLPEGPRRLELPAKAERVVTVRVEELPFMPKSAEYAVRVQSSRPVVVQQTRRYFEQRGVPSTRSTCATLACPLLVRDRREA